MAITWKKLAYEDDVITKAFMASKGDILYASANGVPAVLAIGGDNEVLIVATDVPNWETQPAPVAHTLNSHSVPDGAVDFDLKEATDLVVMTVANEAGLPGANVELGQLCWATSELTLHVCTAKV